MAVNMVLIADGKYGHPDLKKAWDIFARECRNAGRPVPRIYQAAGNAVASADTHRDGMAVDWGSTDEWYAVMWRKITSGPAWPRLWAGNFHTHGVLPNSVSAAYQVTAYRLRRDGLGWLGMKGRDSLTYVAPMPLAAALARWVSIPVDGKLGPVTVRALQNFLNRRKAGLVVDGVWGPATTRAFCEYMSRNGKMRAEDVPNGRKLHAAFVKWQGVNTRETYFGPVTVRQLQKWLNADLV